MMGVFNNIQQEITPLKVYLKYMLEYKLNPIIRKIDTNKAKYEEAEVLDLDLLQVDFFT